MEKKDITLGISVFLILTLFYFSIYVDDSFYENIYGSVGKATSLFSYSAMINNKAIFDQTPNIYYEFNIGNNFYYDLNCTDPDNYTVTYSDNTELFDTNQNTGIIDKTFDANDAGFWNVTVYCFDTLEYTNYTFYLFINPPQGVVTTGGGGGGTRTIKEIIEKIIKEQESIEKISENEMPDEPVSAGPYAFGVNQREPEEKKSVAIILKFVPFLFAIVLMIVILNTLAIEKIK